MPTLSDIKWILIAVAGVILTAILIWGTIALHNRATTITDLNAQLSTANNRITEAVQTANDNAAAAAQLKQQMESNQEALRIKTLNDVQLANDLTKLQDEVSHVQSTQCLPSAIVTMVNGLRHLQSPGNTGAKNSGAKNGNSKPASNAAATTPGTADQLVAQWIGNLYRHDSTCADDLKQILKLQNGATK